LEDSQEIANLENQYKLMKDTAPEYILKKMQNKIENYALKKSF
jgi:hypothetical protein